ncbi:MAG: RNA polymerase sigma-70 factor (ECF subfamily) [Flavobacteriales bacterium]|jgi:RNA polymerase sigma-70 factor (ECF subfamily)|tara:strand:+ start:6874 stop:7470 length:597 start_codon:yes stop_codon:yes gene_type:complete
MKLVNLSDKELVTIYIKGDEIALQELVNRHRSRIYSYILATIKNKALAEDFFQDTFIKVIQTLKGGKYNEEGKFLPWVMRISHNLMIDYFRKEKRFRKVSGKSRDNEEYDVFSTIGYDELNMEERLIKAQVKTDVKELIERLPDEQKEVVKLRHYYDMSFKEISDITNVSINTALGRMRYALINLRKLVEETGVSLEM